MKSSGRAFASLLGALALSASPACQKDPDDTGDADTDMDTDSDSDTDSDTDTDTNDEGSDGPNLEEVNPNVHRVGDATAGRDVFRFETFGNEDFWTDALRLPQGVVAAKFTPIDALKAGLIVDIDALDEDTKAAVAKELMTDLSPEKAPLLNSVDTTVMLIGANAVVGLVAVDSTGDGKIDLARGDKVGVSCALCHTVSDESVFSLPGGGSIGKRMDGPANHNLDVGSSIALGANSRAYYPLLQLALDANGGKSIGRAPKGLTEKSTEAEVDAYLTNKDFYPVGMFDDQPDGTGAPMHNTPMFEADLAAPWGSEGAIQFLDNFSNLVYTVLFDPTDLTTEGGRAFMHTLAGPAGDEIVNDYVQVLAETGVTGYPFVNTSTTGKPGMEATPIGVRVDDTKLINMNAYLNSLPSPPGKDGDAAAIERGRQTFRQQCTSCHNVDQSRFVPSMIVPMKEVWPGFDPEFLADREPPLDDIANSPGIFDDKMVIVNASLRGLEKGLALPLLLDLARKPVFLHDNSVPTLDNLLDKSRGADAPHPFYIDNSGTREDVIEYLESLDTK